MGFTDGLNYALDSPVVAPPQGSQGGTAPLLPQGVGVESRGVGSAHEASDFFNNFRATSSDRRRAMIRPKVWSAEQRFEIVLQSLRGEEPNAQICRRYRISEPTLYKWRRLFLQGAKVFLGGSRPSVMQLTEENQRLKELVVELSLACRKLRLSRLHPGRPTAGKGPST